MLSFVALTLSVAPIKVLFLGNSHTASNNVPAMVASIAASTGRKLEVKMVIGPFLEDVAAQPDVLRSIAAKATDIVVMQAAKVSSSHKYTYPQDYAIKLAKQARAKKIRAIYFCEWKRNGIEETRFIEKVYAGIAKEGGGEIAPVGRVWDAVLERSPKLELWSDGNHANLKGSYLAALVLYRWIANDAQSAPGFRPKGVSEGEAKLFADESRRLHTATRGN